MEILNKHCKVDGFFSVTNCKNFTFHIKTEKAGGKSSQPFPLVHIMQLHPHAGDPQLHPHAVRLPPLLHHCYFSPISE